MTIRLLIVSDIHGNYPALKAAAKKLAAKSFDYILNCGDSTVYGPFANETLNWLRDNNAISILGNTDKKVLKILRGKTFKKPSNPEKRIMYDSTAASLSKKNCRYLQSLPKFQILNLATKMDQNSALRLGIYHGSPARHHEFLFVTTPEARFIELVEQTTCHIILTGHSHTPYYKKISGVHFINPGSVGRMFDGDPRASCATIEIRDSSISVRHFRVDYEVSKTISRLKQENLPEIYCTMFEQGKKLN